MNARVIKIFRSSCVINSHCSHVLQKEREQLTSLKSPPFPENPLVWAGCNLGQHLGSLVVNPRAHSSRSPMLSSMHWASHRGTALSERRSHPMEWPCKECQLCSFHPLGWKSICHIMVTFASCDWDCMFVEKDSTIVFFLFLYIEVCVLPCQESPRTWAFCTL